MISMKLDKDAWDLGMDGSRNIAMTTSEPERVAQDVASSVRTFSAECIFDQDRGMPYFGDVLGQSPPLSLVNSLVETEASRVPGISTATSSIADVTDRVLTGDITITTNEGTVTNVNLA